MDGDELRLSLGGLVLEPDLGQILLYLSALCELLQLPLVMC